MDENTQKIVNSRPERHTHLDMSFLGCLLAFALEIYFFDEIFVPQGGGASFGLIVLMIINVIAVPIVMTIMTIACLVMHIPRNRLNCTLVCVFACVLTIAGLFIAYPVGR